MIPTVNTSTPDKTVAAHKTTALPKSARHSMAVPKLSASPVKAASPGLLSLNLKAVLHKGDLETDLQDNGSSSPSSRSKTRVERSITEVRSHKRAIDGTDGPGITSEHVQKRQKTATPPGSVRGNSSPRKQMVKSSRAVTDLSAMVSDALQRRDTASPPPSPRTGSPLDHSGEAQVQSAPDQEFTSPALAHNVLRASILPQSASAPQWRASSFPDLGGSKQPNTGFPPAWGGESLDAYRPTTLPLTQTPVAGPASEAVLSADPAEFTFTDCDYGQDGQLIGGKGLPTSASLSGHGSSSTMFIKTELSISAQVQKEAAAAYLGVLRERAGAGGMAKAANGSPANLLTSAQTELETAVLVLELAFESATADELATYLKQLVSAVAGYRTALAAQGDAIARAGFSKIVTLTREALSDSLGAMETACSSGLAQLADEKVHALSLKVDKLPPSSRTMMDDLNDLDDLMNSEILPANSGAASAAAPGQ
jgi:hypothetical protein